ncbi:MAG: porin [Ectothiorhodospira sp.]
MKKTVLAIAVAAAVGVPAAAVADTTLYGRLNLSLDFVDNDQDSSHQLASNSSRLGVRGSEDLGMGLGMGLKGIYQMEAGFDAATGEGNLATRNTYLGLAGNFGELRLGKHDTAYKTATLPLNFFADTLGDMNHVTSRMASQGQLGDGLVQGVRVSPGFYNRNDNSLVYMSPDLDGMRFMANYTTDVNDDTAREGANDQKAFSLAGTFEQGPMYLAVAYEQQKIGPRAMVMVRMPMPPAGRWAAPTTWPTSPWRPCTRTWTPTSMTSATGTPSTWAASTTWASPT